jgi:hypothetical protein
MDWDEPKSLEDILPASEFKEGSPSEDNLPPLLTVTEGEDGWDEETDFFDTEDETEYEDEYELEAEEEEEEAEEEEETEEVIPEEAEPEGRKFLVKRNGILDFDNVQNLANMLSKVKLVWPENMPWFNEAEYSTDPVCVAFICI